MKKIIIVGSGIGGLIAGNFLAKKGHKVVIFEAHNMPGGYTAGFYRKGYYFESGTVAFEASASIFKAMKDLGLFERINFAKMSYRFVSGRFDATPRDYDDYKKKVYADFPSEKERLDGIFTNLDKIAGLMETMNQPLPYLYSGLEMLKSILPNIFKGPKIIKLANQYGDITSTEFAAKYFEKDTQLFKLFCGFGYPDMPVLMAGSALSGLFTDIWTIKEGMQSWADILAENFRKLGGELKLNSYVEKIITKNGTAIGAISKNAVYNGDYIIAAGDYKKTLLKLIDDQSLIPEKIKNNIERASVSEGYFTVYLGLNMTNDELSKYLKVPHVIVFNNKPGCDINDSTDSEFFSKATAELFSPSMVNPKHAPEGKSSMMLQTKAPYRWMNNWGGGDRERYRQLKEKAMNAMIEEASGLVFGLKEHIEFQDAATPLTYERFTHNTDGASCAWSWNPKKNFYKDGISVNIKTPVKNLYIGSCWAMQNGGVPGAIAAAYQCAARIK